MQARKQGLSSAAKNLTISDDLEKSQQERIDIFYSFVQVFSGLMSPSKDDEIKCQLFLNVSKGRLLV